VDEAKTLFADTLSAGRHFNHPHIIMRALVGLARLDLQENNSAEASNKLAEAFKLAENSYSRRLMAEIKLTQSHQQAAAGDLAAAQATWQETEKLLKILRLPVTSPEWLAQKT
jgi:ABC-type uncharacterized transport system ATPase subunit